MRSIPRKSLPSEKMRAMGVEKKDLRIERDPLPSEMEPSAYRFYNLDAIFYHQSMELADRLHASLIKWQEAKAESERRKKNTCLSIVGASCSIIKLILEPRTVASDVIHQAWKFHKYISALLQTEELPQPLPLQHINDGALKDDEKIAEHETWRLIDEIGKCARGYPKLSKAVDHFQQCAVPMIRNMDHVSVDTTLLLSEYGLTTKMKKTVQTPVEPAPCD